MTKPTNRFENLQPQYRTAVILLFLTIFLFVLFAFGEGVVRFRQYLKHGAGFSSIENLYEFDKGLNLRVPVAGYRSSRISINTLGFRGPEIQTPKPAGIVRIAFLGASTTFCAEVSGDNAVWADKVIKRLAAYYPDKKFDYINGGVPGYLVRSSIKNFQHRIKPLDPDIIVIYHATNDLTFRSRSEARRLGWTRSDGDNQLSWLSKYSMMSNLIEKNILIWLAKQSATKLIKDDKKQLKLSTKLTSEPFKKDILKLIDMSYKVTENVVLVTFSTAIRQEQSVFEKSESAVTSLYYMPYMTLQGLIDHFAAYNVKLREAGRETGTLVIDGENDIPGTKEYFVDSVHFTDLGSERMAQRVADALILEGIVNKVQSSNSRKVN